MTSYTALFNRVRNADLSWARVVSNVLSPPVVSALMVIPVAVAYSISPRHALLWSLLYILATSVIPTAYIAWLVRRGEITDIHMPIRSERYRPYAMTILCTVVAWWIMRVMGASPVLPLLAVFSLAQILVMACITVFWQISMHTMTITGAAVAFGLFFDMSYALWMLPLILLVGAARLYLKRHTPAQIIGGTAVGAMVPMLVLLIIPL